MTKDEALLRYKTAMAVFKTWLSQGAISEADLLAIDTTLGEKYGLSSTSIYRENTCYVGKKE